MSEVEDESMCYENNGAALEAELVKIKLQRFLTDDEYKLIDEITSTTESVYNIIKRYNISSTKYLKLMERVKKILVIKNTTEQDHESI
jgi:aspartate carbamoyltransferase regulatory subunit